MVERESWRSLLREIPVLALLMILFGFFPIFSIYEAYEISSNPVQSIAVISEYKPEKRSNSGIRWTNHIHKLSYDGFSSTETLDHEYPIGSELAITYAKNSPIFHYLGHQKLSSLEIVHQHSGWLAVPFGILFLICAYRFVYNIEQVTMEMLSGITGSVKRHRLT